ncbi:UDP-2,4-diacetamido-2,4,6-trideoxy-beta-L-altropyranose hydrolase [Spirosoma fluminis]
MSKKVFFRADGNPQIGLGHIMRCLALAEMLGSNYERRFAIVHPSQAVVKLVEEKGLTVVPLASNELADFLSNLDSETVAVLDGYNFDESYQRAVRSNAKTLVYIDDLVSGHQVADLVINHAGGLTPKDYQAEVHTQFFLGPRYALLRPAFFAPPTPVPTEGPIFISLGGADPSHTSLSVLKGLRSYFDRIQQEWRIHIVVGPLQSNRPAIEALQSQFKHLHLLSNLTADQMVAELTKCQLAITSCSTVAYEVCSIGRPLIAIQTADNQVRLASFLVDNGLANVYANDFPLDGLSTGIEIGTSSEYEDVRQLIVRNQRRYFDGRSPERFRALFDRLCSPTV